MTPFEDATVRVLGGLLEELRFSRESRVKFEREVMQKLDSAIAHRDEAISQDLASTNNRVSALERLMRSNGHSPQT